MPPGRPSQHHSGVRVAGSVANQHGDAGAAGNVRRPWPVTGCPTFGFRRVGPSFSDTQKSRNLSCSIDSTETYPLTDQLSCAAVPLEIDFRSCKPGLFVARPKSAHELGRRHFCHSVAPLRIQIHSPRLRICMIFNRNVAGISRSMDGRVGRMLPFSSPPCLPASTLP